jgi:hypothetical protein
MSPTPAQAADNLLKRCMAWLHRFVALSPQQAVVIAARALHTWVIDAAEWTPYLHVTAPEKAVSIPIAGGAGNYRPDGLRPAREE